ncbi:MAG: DNA-processing protein DprA [Chloroflexi bacterium]|nr:DNA-processing protein DprA [Chloroflexota bacterium]
MSISPNTQVILLLTAPLIAGRKQAGPDRLTLSEYNRLVRCLRDNHREPADLLGPETDEILRTCASGTNETRIKELLGRGFLLSQAIERWQTHAIWVISRADPEYPHRLKDRLKSNAPPVLYGCGDTLNLDSGGLAVVGSRNVDEVLVGYTVLVGRMAAKSGRSLVSGGARGVDRAAMRGALEAGGTAVGILADGLERASIERDNRGFLLDGKLVLISPFDPSSGFNVGHAMQRNKLIYALSDAALVVRSDYQRGGTWAGAVEQLEKLRLVPVYVRAEDDPSKGLEALSKKGARPWPNPTSVTEFNDALAADFNREDLILDHAQMSFFAVTDSERAVGVKDDMELESLGHEYGPFDSQATRPSQKLFATVRSLLANLDSPKSEAEVADDLEVTTAQARDWLTRLVEEGVLNRSTRPVRYSAASQKPLFNKRD